MNNITEEDWCLFKEKIILWQERYIRRLNDRYIRILSGSGSAAEKFWKLEKRINDDKESAGVIVEMRRSAVIPSVLALLRDGVITEDELSEFSDALKQSVNCMLK